jgi:putative peptidoglycan lipid II flippase
MYNLGIIIGVIFFLPTFGIMGLAYGVVLGAVLHMAIQLPVLGFHGFIPKFVRDISWKDIKDIVIVSVPRTIGLSISSFTAVILTSLASTLATGSITVFNLTNNMLNIPIGIIGISYSVASFPTLVKLFQQNERAKFADHIVEATRKIIFLAAPITVLFIVLRAQIIRVILGAHSFSWNDTRIAAACLALFVIGMVCEALVYLLVRGYYAIGNTKTPLLWNFVGEIFTIILAIIFVWMFRTIPAVGNMFVTVLRLQGVPNLEILALPFAFSLGNILNFFTLWYVFVRDFPDAKTAPVWKTVFEATTASCALGIASYETLQITALIFNQQTFWGIFMQGAVSALVGVIVAVIVLRIMGNRDILDIWHAMKRKFWKSNVIQEVGEAVDN